MNTRLAIMQSKILQYILLLFYIFFFTEFFLRIFLPVPILPRYIKEADYGIRSNLENKTYVHKTAEYKIEIRTNSKGIRADYNIPYEKSSEVKRIVILGDSFAMGYGVNLEDTFTEIMVNTLEEKTSEKYEIINLATSGHGNAEELIVLQNEGIKYSPDIVLLCWHRTDLDDNTRSDLYQLRNGELVSTGKDYLPGVEAREKLFSIPGFEFIANNSHLYNKMRDSMGAFIKRIMVSPFSRQDNTALSEEDIKAIEKNRVDLCVKLISEINKTSEEANAKLIILDIPDKLSRTCYISKIPDLSYWDSTSDIPVFSPIQDLIERSSPETKMYWEKSHGHFTPLGCSITGEGLGNFIYEKIY